MAVQGFEDQSTDGAGLSLFQVHRRERSRESCRMQDKKPRLGARGVAQTSRGGAE